MVVKLDLREGPELAIMEALARHPELSSSDSDFVSGLGFRGLGV